MPVQSNPAVQNVATIAFAGQTPYAADIRKFVRFGWSFEVVAALAADFTFQIEAAPPSALDDCQPGAFTTVDATPICSDEAIAAGPALVTIPAGTPVGTICSGTIPCRPAAFVRLTPTAGLLADAPVRAVLVRQGPKI